MPIEVRPIEERDRDAVWAILRPVLAAGETYALPRDWTRDEALDFWIGGDHTTFVAEDDGAVVGTYYIHPNQRGGGAHVCNCGYVTRTDQAGRGVARTMALHSLDVARASGFRAMQYNLVVSTNVRAVALWHSLGFETVGRLPGAFRHPSAGFVDCLVMFRAL